MGDAAESERGSMDEMVTCPICNANVPLAGIERHIDMGCPPPPRAPKIEPPKPSAPAVPPAPVADFPVASKKKPQKKGNSKPNATEHSGAAAKPQSKGPHAKPQPTAPAEAFPALGTPVEAFPSLGSVTKAPAPPSQPRPLSQPLPHPSLPQPPPAPLAPSAKAEPPLPPSEELRIDPADGNAYTLADFVAEYGGTREWELAQPATAAMPPPQAQIQPQLAPSVKAEPPLPPSEELRIDPADGNAYTRADFVAEYGGTREWELAHSAAPAAAASAWGSKPAAALFTSTIGGSAAAAAPRPSPAMTAAAAATATAAAQAAVESASRRFSQLTLEELYDERLVKAPVLHPPRPRSFDLQEVVQGKRLNSLQGLALYDQVLSPVEQQLTLIYCHRLKDLGDDGVLVGRTYSAPRKWRKGNGRITVQMGCCYNYATDKDGHPPGILPHEPVCGMPPFLEDLIDRMVSRGIFTSRTRPDSCIINFYSSGDCIPPHIDHHDFTRPFVTLSLLSEQSILFGSNIEIINEGEFAAPFSTPLPVGSVLVLDGNGANVAKHCVPSVGADRVSITFRKINAKLKSKMTPGFHGPHGAAVVPPPQRR